ncbi:uncharacterized protein LOC129747376 isoform X2 [Uranotaenia lowii]|uniref:uncharacterized protein LOC129747376 isoform X2 n=1 Tax=Uranotaenia lowii TaxID=190385 RepID=UPI0024783CEF|nr:uncharacterized protein LOC129747376 isoform X2 [Uranotaenia lowii]
MAWTKHHKVDFGITMIAVLVILELQPVLGNVRDPRYYSNNNTDSLTSSINISKTKRSHQISASTHGSTQMASYGPSKPPSQYTYEHVQSGSITLPRGSKAFLEPDQNRTLAYSTRTDGAVHRSPKGHRRNQHHHQQHQYRARHMADWSSANGIATTSQRRSHEPGVKTAVVNGLCIRCPAEKTAIARKGLDGVLIEPPMLTTCRNQPISRDLYELETLFGAKFNFILPHSNGGGPYSFLAKVVNRRSGKVVQTCDLRYKVVVKQCGRYHPKNKDLKVLCDLGHIWGSRCSFHCRNGGYPSRQNAYVECNEDQKWEGEEPFCMYNDISDDYAYDNDAPHGTSDCSYPIPPNNGRFACEMNNPDSDGSNDLYVPNGTICRIKCSDNFEIPAHLQSVSAFECHEGRWNSTMKHFCHKKAAPGSGLHHPKRRYG